VKPSPAEFIEMLRKYRQSYADSVLAFAQGRDIDGHHHTARAIQAEIAILKAVYPEIPL
jgi:hypothetical protein